MDNKPFLTKKQVESLNDKWGYFEFGDAQGDVSRSFAQDAIAMHERIKAAASDLLDALETIGAHTITDEDGDEVEVLYGNISKIKAALAKARGES